MKWLRRCGECLVTTVVSYGRWLVPLVVLQILPVRVETGFRWWRRVLAPDWAGDESARRAGEAGFLLMLAYPRSMPFTKRIIANLVLTAVAPLYALGQALRQTARHGRQIRASDGISRRMQIFQQYVLYLRHPWWLIHQADPDWYYRKRFFKPARYARAGHSIPSLGVLVTATTTLWIRNQRRRKASRPSDRKSVQFRRLREASVPTIPLLATVGRGRLEFQPGVGVDSLPETGLFAKPDGGTNGRGALAWDRLGPGRYVEAGDPDRREITLNDLLKFLRNRPVDHVLQPRLASHPDLRDLAGDTLASARILTYTDPRTLEAAVFPFGFFKVPHVGVIVDNIHVPSAPRGMGSGVCMATGLLGPALAPDLKWYDRHPERGSPITGRSIPRWAEAVEVALAAHRAFRPHGWAWGWDVAVTQEGPVIIEGNSHPFIDEEYEPDRMFGDLPEIDLLVDLCLLADRS